MRREEVHSISFHDHAARRISAVSRALGFDASFEARAIDLFRAMTSPWGDLPVGRRPRWLSDITDDHTPYELSVALEGDVPELRFLIEAQSPGPFITSKWTAGRRLASRLERELGASLDRLRKIERLFIPTDPWARFALWYAVNLRPDAPPAFKVYLNPQAHGREKAGAVVEAALARLELDSDVVRRLLARGPLDELKYLSLDLSAGPAARVKLYTAHRQATAACLEAKLELASGYSPGEATDVCRTLAGHAGPFRGMPPLSCLAFAEDPRRPRHATLHFPIRGYARHDGEARERILRLMNEPDRPLFRRVVEAFAHRRLEDGIGLQTWVSYRRQAGRRHVTVYLAPEVYGVKRPGRRKAGGLETVPPGAAQGELGIPA